MKKEKEGLTTISVRLPKDKWQTFLSLTKKQDTTASREIRRFIDRYISSHKKKKEKNE